MIKLSWKAKSQIFGRRQILPHYIKCKNKGDKSDTTNYRPVSLTCLPSRLCEKTVRESIMNHMTLNNLFTDCQFGLRHKRSCILQLLDVLDDWSKYYDENKQIDTVYLDIKKRLTQYPIKDYF